MSKKPETTVRAEDLPYRPAVGAAVFNLQGDVWIGRRSDAPEEAEGPGNWWQMPQGGLDQGEEPQAGALRELYEETSIRSVSLIAEAPDWFAYDLPDALVGHAWKGRYRGQRQKWFAFRFEGEETEIDVLHPGGGKHHAEFSQWQWVPLDRLPDLVVPFKRKVYEEVVAAFRDVGPA